MKILNFFNSLTLKQIFWKTKTCFKQVGYSFLVESTMIENASFPYKTAISEANVKTNKMVSTKCTYHRERSFSSNYFIFLKILFQFLLALEFHFTVLCPCMLKSSPKIFFFLEKYYQKRRLMLIGN